MGVLARVGQFDRSRPRKAILRLRRSASDATTSGSGLILPRFNALISIFLVYGPGPLQAEPDPHLHLHVVYYCPHGLEPAKDFQGRLDRIMTDIQAFYREEMRKNGYGPVTFPLMRDAEGKLKIHIINADEPLNPQVIVNVQQVTQKYIRPAFKKRQMDADKTWLIVFQNVYHKENGVWRFNASFTGFGNQRNGRAWIVDHVGLDIPNLEKKTPELNDRDRKTTLGNFNVYMIGGIAHELGHSFGLPHNADIDKARNGNALMGYGNYTYRQKRYDPTRKSAYLSAAHALALSVHPLFTRTLEDVDAPVTYQLRNLEFQHDRGDLLIVGQVRGSPKIYGVIGYNDKLPAGTNRDYDATSWAARVSEDGHFSLRVGRLAEGDFQLRLRFCHANSARSVIALNYKTNSLRVPDIDVLQRNVTLMEVRKAFAGKNAQKLKRWRKKLAGKRDDFLKRADHYQQRMDAWEKLTNPGQVAEATESISLSSLKWKSAQVGWFSPAYDGYFSSELGTRMPLLDYSGKTRKGIYAHAVSRFVYDLDGRWRKFRATCALQKDVGGSVVFVAKADGKEVLRTAIIRRGEKQDAEFDVSGVKELELIVEPSPDGKNSDWGLWLSPVLSR